MPTNYTSLTNGQFATAAVFNAPLTELDNAIQAMVTGTKTLTAPDINGGTIDGATIGGSTPGAGTFSDLIVNATATSIKITGPAGNPRGVFLQSTASNRWLIYVNDTAESSTATGSDLQIAGYNNSGAFINNYVTLTRSSGNVAFTGTMSKGGGSFNIDHPLDPLNKNLIHSFVEGPRADLIYRGSVTLVAGQAIVDIDLASRMTPGTLAALTKHTEAEIFLQNKTGFVAVRGVLNGGLLTINAQNNGNTDTIAWMVIAERNDAFYRASDLTDTNGQFITEVDKPAPTPAELQQLTDAPIGEIVYGLVGKKGYPQHAHLTGLARPIGKKGKTK